MSKKLTSFAELAALSGKIATDIEKPTPSEGLVYSTDVGRIKHQPPATTVAIGNGKVRISRSSKGRGGKTVTIVTGLPLTEEALKQLCVQLKKQLGCGGTVTLGDLEFQGDKRDPLLAALTKAGYTAKISGG